MSSSLTITAQNIIDHRNSRKAAGLVGCISGRPAPALDFFGYRDVQIWNTDATGRMNGSPGFDRMNPGCFCFDHRSAFDPRAEVDLELVKNGHVEACRTYASLLPADMVPPPRDVAVSTSSSFAGAGDSPSLREGDELPRLALPMRSNGGGVDWPPRVNTAQLSYGSFSNVPMSLPAPRARDIMNESPAERLRGDLGVLRGRLQSDLVVAMDRARDAVCYDDPEERAAFLVTVREDEQALWRKLEAVDLLLSDA